MPTPEPTTASNFEYVDCPSPNIEGVDALDFPPEVRCGYLTVPENRDDPEGKQIRIFVMRAPAASDDPKPDPIVMLAGGPGGAGSFEITGKMAAGLNAEREVIFVDQRGTHFADPLLSCPEAEQADNDSISIPFLSAEATAATGRGQRGVHKSRTGRGLRPGGIQHRRECGRLRRPAGRAGHRRMERLRRLLRIAARVGVLARSPRRHPQRRARFGVAPEREHRRRLVVRPRELVPRDIRGMRRSAVVRCGVSRPRGRLLRNGEPARRDARGRGDDGFRRPAAHRQHRRLPVPVRHHHGKRARRCVGRAQDDR